MIRLGVVIGCCMRLADRPSRRAAVHRDDDQLTAAGAQPQ